MYVRETVATFPGNIPSAVRNIGLQISNRNRRRNKEKKKLRETAPDNISPGRKGLPAAGAPFPTPGGAGSSVAGASGIVGNAAPQLLSLLGGGAPGSDPSSAAGGEGAVGGEGAASGGLLDGGPAANYFSGRKRPKGDVVGGGQGHGGGLGLLLDRGKGSGGTGGGAGGDSKGVDDTMEFMEVCWS